MLDGSLLQRLPLEWQQKIHSEFQCKLSLCISDPEEVRKAAAFTWQSLIGGVRSREWLCQQFEPHLKIYAGDFADWVLDFVAQAITHFQSLDSLFVTSTPNHTTPTVQQPTGDDVTATPSLGQRVDVGATSTAQSSIIASAMNEDSSPPITSTSQLASGATVSFVASNGGNFKGPNGTTNTVVFGTGTRSGSFWPQQRGGNGQISTGFGGNSCYDISMSSNVQQSGGGGGFGGRGGVDPLDDTLDNLILKQKMHKMQGRGDTPFGVRMRSTKFGSPHRTDGTNNLVPFDSSPGVSQQQQQHPQQGNVQTNDPHSPFGMATQPHRPHAATNGVKIPIACKKYPNCEFGDNCRYMHPSSTRCKHWPNCAFGSKCVYVHPPVPCRFNKACTNPNCNYEHTD